MWEDEYFNQEEFEVGAIANRLYSEIKQMALSAVKTEIKNELENLRDEVNQLRYLKEHMDEIESEYKEKCKAIDDERKTIEADYRKQLVADILEPFKQTYYTIRLNQDFCVPKCDKCDEHRMIHFKSPSGKDLCEACSCNVTKPMAYVEPVELCRIDISHDYKHKISLRDEVKDEYVIDVNSRNVTYNFSRQNETSLTKCHEKSIDPKLGEENFILSHNIYSTFDKAQAFCDRYNSEHNE